MVNLPQVGPAIDREFVRTFVICSRAFAGVLRPRRVELLPVAGNHHFICIAKRRLLDHGPPPSVASEAVRECPGLCERVHSDRAAGVPWPLAVCL